MVFKRGFSTTSFTHQLAKLDASQLTITKTKTPKTYPKQEDLLFGKILTDHILSVDWTKNGGWDKPKIEPYAPFNIDPAASVFHYGFECFEGMKAFKDSKGVARLFRPDMNMARLNRSVSRISLPTFDQKENG